MTLDSLQQYLTLTHQDAPRPCNTVGQRVEDTEFLRKVRALDLGKRRGLRSQCRCPVARCLPPLVVEALIKCLETYHVNHPGLSVDGFIHQLNRDTAFVGATRCGGFIAAACL